MFKQTPCKIVIKKLLFIFILLAGASQALAHDEYVKVRFPAQHSIQELIKDGLDIDHGLEKHGSMYECIVSRRALSTLSKNNIPYEIVIQDMETFYESRLIKEYPAFLKQLSGNQILTPKNFVTGSMGGYYTLEEIYQQMNRIREYAPDIVSFSDTIGYTSENRPILAWHITSSKSDTNATLLTALHHAREPGGATTLLYFLWEFIEKVKSGNQEENYLINNRVLTVVPCVNPDGYAFNQSQKPNGGGLWRKNRKNIGANIGVDLNRNYGPLEYWDAPNGGSSTDPNSDVYRGPEPFSEPETKALKSLCEKHEYDCILNYHTYSNLLIYPFAALSSETPDSSAFRGFAADAARYNRYSAGRDLETVGYTTRGNSDDWAYDAHGAFAFTPEVGAYNDGFWPSPSRILGHAKENLHMNYQALWSAAGNVVLREAIILDNSTTDMQGTFWIDIQNIGRKSIDDTVTIFTKALHNKVKVIDSIVQFSNIVSGEHRNSTLRYALEMNYRNGDSTTFIITIMQHGISRSDTVSFPLYSPEKISLFKKQSDTNNFFMNSWGVLYYPEFNGYALADSPQGLYQAEKDSYVQTNHTYDLTQYKSAFLRMNTRWSIEPQADFAVVQISNDDGRTWEYLSSSRMVPGTGMKDGKQSADGFGFQGNFPDWEHQVFDLKKYIGRKVLFRFGVLSDRGAEFDGFIIRDVEIFGYRDSMSNIQEQSQHQDLTLELFPVPTSNVLYLSLSYPHALLQSTNGTVSVFNALGKEVMTMPIAIQAGNESIAEIPVHGLPSGVYSIKVVTADNQTVSQSCIITQ